MDLSQLSLILAATQHAAEGAADGAAEEHHKSEMPFFVAGGIFAVFAVAISVYGFKHPDFPATASAARGVMTAGAVLMLGAVSMAVYVAL
jgi:hypothetical protein